MTQGALDYAVAHAEEHLEQLIELLSIASVSTLPEHEEDIRRAARWVAGHMDAIGLDDVRVYETAGHPVVYGGWTGAGAGAPTVLVYGHYDVQPVDPLDEWRSDPFEPTVRDGNLHARGASDDKGQFFTHLKSAEAYLQTQGELPVNVKFMIEGEEEVGSPHLSDFMREHAERLAADVAVVSDTHMLGPDQPSIQYGLRGIVSAEVVVTGPDHDLHSGSFGGAVRNPVNALCAIVAALKDGDGRITIPGFYDRVRLEPAERERLAAVPFDEEGFRRHAGVAALWGEAGYSTLERTSARPTLDVNGIWGGFTGEGGKTIIPARAAAKISMRLVPDQDPNRLLPRFSDHVRELAPPEVAVEIRDLHGSPPVLIDRDIPEMQAAVRAYERGFGKAPVFTRAGGGIPVVALFSELLQVPTVLMGFGLPDDRLHSPNERFAIVNFQKGTRTSIHFLDALKSH